MISLLPGHVQSCLMRMLCSDTRGVQSQQHMVQLTSRSVR